MRVLQLLTHDRIASGGAVQALLLGRELARLGVAVTIAMDDGGGKAANEDERKVRDAGCDFARVPLRGWRGRLSGTRRLVRLFERGFDVVHLHREHALERFVAAAPRLPRVTAIANIGTITVPSRKEARRLADPCIDRIVVVADAIRDMLVAKHGLDPSRIETVYGAFDEERFDPRCVRPLDRERDLGVPPDAPIVGVVANYAPKKGARRFLSAAQKVATEFPTAFFVWLGGGDLELLRSEARKVDPAIEQRLITPGFRDDVPRFITTFDVVVSSSTRGEGLSGAMRESLAMGTPVVATDVGGNREIVRNGETGLLVPPRDTSALAAAIVTALHDRDSVRRMAERGCAEVRSRLTSAQRARAMLSLYREASG